MRYKDYIKAGNKCIYVPSNHPFASDNEQFGCEYDELFGNALKLVEVGEHRPFYANGFPNPAPDLCDELCLVEVYHPEDGPIQAYFPQLLPFIEAEDDETVIYQSRPCSVLGYDPNREYYVIEYEGETLVRCSSQVQVERDITELTYDELKVLRGQIVLGSCYTADYQNEFGVNPKIVSDYGDEYMRELAQKFDEDAGSIYDTPEAFANFILDGEAYPEVRPISKIQILENGKWIDFIDTEFYEDEAFMEMRRLKESAPEREFRMVLLRYEGTVTLTVKSPKNYASHATH